MKTYDVVCTDVLEVCIKGVDEVSIDNYIDALCDKIAVCNPETLKKTSIDTEENQQYITFLVELKRHGILSVWPPSKDDPGEEDVSWNKGEDVYDIKSELNKIQKELTFLHDYSYYEGDYEIA